MASNPPAGCGCFGIIISHYYHTLLSHNQDQRGGVSFQSFCALFFYRLIGSPALLLARGSARETYRSGRVLVVNFQVGHGLDDSHDGLDCVAVDNCSVLFALVL